MRKSLFFLAYSLTFTSFIIPASNETEIRSRELPQEIGFTDDFFQKIARRYLQNPEEELDRLKQDGNFPATAIIKNNAELLEQSLQKWKQEIEDVPEKHTLIHSKKLTAHVMMILSRNVTKFFPLFHKYGFERSSIMKSYLQKKNFPADSSSADDSKDGKLVQFNLGKEFAELLKPPQMKITQLKAFLEALKKSNSQ